LVNCNKKNLATLTFIQRQTFIFFLSLLKAVPLASLVVNKDVGISGFENLPSHGRPCFPSQMTKSPQYLSLPGSHIKRRRKKILIVIF
jgi:hypothetical protein